MSKQKNWSCIILAAGSGTRMKSRLPKVLHRVAGKSLLTRSLDLVNSLKKFKKKLVVVGHGANNLGALLPNDCISVRQKPLLGTGHALIQTLTPLKQFRGHVLVLCADVPLLKRETLKKFVEKHERGDYDCSILTGCVEDPFGYGRILRDQKAQAIKGIIEEKEANNIEKRIHEINSGIYCFKWTELKKALRKIRIHQSKKEYYLTDVVEHLKKRNAYCVADANEIQGINSRSQLAEAEKILRLRKCEALMDKGVSIMDPASTFIDDEVEIGKDSIIYPFTVIEGKVKIGRSCEIGPFSHLREGVILKDEVEIGNFVEVKKSKLAKGVKAKHLTYLGDAEIGEQTNIGAGTITANYDGEKKHLTSIGAKAFIGSGTILVAPVYIGKEAVTGAGAVVTRGKHVPDKSVVVGVPARILRKQKGEK